MRRVAVVFALAISAAAAVLLPAPPPLTLPLEGLVVESPGISSPADAGIWYCPWAQSDAERDSTLSVASVEAAVARLTFPLAVPGEAADSATLEVPGPGAAEMSLSEVARRGDSPFLVEFAGGPAAASVLVSGTGVLAADACVAAGPQRWHFPGGSTMPGEHLTLRLFNPFPESAKVAVTAVSDIGIEAIGELRAVSVGPRSWKDIQFETLLRQRQNLVVTVEAEEGLIVPAMAFGTEADEDWWPGVGESLTWEFPVVRMGDTQASLVVSNPGSSPVDVTVDVFTPEGPVLEALTATVTPDAPLRLDLSQFPGDSLAARLTATGPVSAAVVARGATGVAVMPGLSGAESSWLLPGVGSTLGYSASLWLLNTSEEPVSATVGALTSDGLLGEMVVVPPGRPFRLEVTVEPSAGLWIEATAPVTAAWSVMGPTGVAFAAGSPVPPAGE
jgi:hypothetical protein